MEEREEQGPREGTVTGDAEIELGIGNRDQIREG